MLIVGTDPATNRQALELTQSQPGFYPTVGWHPHDAKDWTQEGWTALCAQAEDPRVVAVGEVGLDYFKNFSPVDEQKNVFSESIRLARRIRKPLVVHSRDAHEDVLTLLREEGGREVAGLMHCFSADQTIAEAALDIGFYISFSAVLTYPKNTVLREIAVSIPADRVLVETDCPFLPPQDRRGQRNEPSAVKQVVSLLSQLRKTSPEQMAEQIWENAQRLFKLS